MREKDVNERKRKVIDEEIEKFESSNKKNIMRRATQT